MKAYLAVAKTQLQTVMAYRLSFFFTLLSHSVILFITYFLWKAVYADTETLNNLDFNTAFSSVAMSLTLYQLYQTYVKEEINEGVHDGNIARDLLKPVDIQLMYFSVALGNLFLNFLIVALPSFFLLFFAFGIRIPLGMNLLYFLISIVFSYIISFLSEFIVGVISFYTIAVWGVGAVWGTLTLLLSGALIPLDFFPPLLNRITLWLPFRAMFSLPMKILFSDGHNYSLYLQGFAQQLAWILILLVAGRSFFKWSLRKISIQGG